MLLPIGTDAPIYHRPIGTVALILANIAFFIHGDCWSGHPVPEFTLQLGQGLHPAQWLTANFVHFGLLHLIGNLISLFAFGLVVEGKLGWWRFTTYYLLIGVFGCFLIQLLYLRSAAPHATAGASFAICGLLATVMIWAPENEVEYVWAYRYWGYWDGGTSSVSYLRFGLGYLALNFLGYCCHGLGFGSHLGDLVGALIGGGLAIAMLIFKRVDCEGWDLLAIMAPRTLSSQKPHSPNAGSTSADVQLAAGPRESLLKRKRRIRVAASNKDWQQVCTALAALPQNAIDHVLTPVQLKHAADFLYQRRQFREAAPLYERLVARYALQYPASVLKLAAVLVEVEQRPKAALRILGRIESLTLKESHQRQFDRIAQLARRLIASGHLELSGRV